MSVSAPTMRRIGLKLSLSDLWSKGAPPRDADADVKISRETVMNLLMQSSKAAVGEPQARSVGPRPKIWSDAAGTLVKRVLLTLALMPPAGLFINAVAAPPNAVDAPMPQQRRYAETALDSSAAATVMPVATQMADRGAMDLPPGAPRRVDRAVHGGAPAFPAPAAMPSAAQLAFPSLQRSEVSLRGSNDGHGPLLVYHFSGDVNVSLKGSRHGATLSMEMRF